MRQSGPLAARVVGPYDDHMARTQTIVQLSDELLAVLDEEAAHRGVSRSALIREAVERHLAESERAATGRRIVEGYRQVPQAVPDVWGDPDASADASARELVQRLDTEEANTGLDEW